MFSRVPRALPWAIPFCPFGAAISTLTRVDSKHDALVISITARFDSMHDALAWVKQQGVAPDNQRQGILLQASPQRVVLLLKSNASIRLRRRGISCILGNIGKFGKSSSTLITGITKVTRTV